VTKYLSLVKVGKEFRGPDGRNATVVQGFDLALDAGEFVCLIGHSGCGKSTVLSMVAGLVPASEGWMNLDGRPITGPGPDRGVVFQSPCLLPWMTAFDNVMLGVSQAHRDRPRAERRKLAAHYLTLVGLGDAMYKRPAELSGGMRQRVGIARAFALDPKMLLLDEPFGALDSLTRFELQQVLIDLWARDRKTALMVTHDVDEALFLSDRVAMMTSGPAAYVGGILDVPFPRPRNRAAVLEHPDYYRLREELIGFLELHACRPPSNSAVDSEEATAVAGLMPKIEPVDVVPAALPVAVTDGCHRHEFNSPSTEADEPCLRSVPRGGAVPAIDPRT
jgi:nitrate/nitrite transport system ATP-binding protein